LVRNKNTKLNLNPFRYNGKVLQEWVDKTETRGTQTIVYGK
jgi:hypothetical protein